MRTLPLDRDTLEMLRDYIKRGGPVKQRGRRPMFGINRYRADKYIFLTGVVEQVKMGDGKDIFLIILRLGLF